MIVISDPKITKEIFSTDAAFTGRFPVFQMYEGETHGVIFSEGETWEVHRRFLLRQLRDFGFGKSSMQSLISDEVSELIENLKKKKGTPVEDIRGNLKLAVVNSLWRILTSKRFKQDDPQLLRFANESIEYENESFFVFVVNERRKIIQFCCICFKGLQRSIPGWGCSHHDTLVEKLVPRMEWLQ